MGRIFDTFSDGNRGRLITIELLDSEAGDQELIKDAPLWAIVYDPLGKGNDLVIETGQNTVSYAHTVDAPTEVWTGQDENGLILALKVLDEKTGQTIVQLQ